MAFINYIYTHTTWIVCIVSVLLSGLLMTKVLILPWLQLSAGNHDGKEQLNLYIIVEASITVSWVGVLNLASLSAKLVPVAFSQKKAPTVLHGSLVAVEKHSGTRWSDQLPDVFW